MRRQIVAWMVAAGCALALIAVGPPSRLSAQQAGNPFPDPNANLDPAVFGRVSPLIPMQSTEAVHLGLVWKRNSDDPKLLYHARFP